jgi:hypothetical protein
MIMHSTTTSLPPWQIALLAAGTRSALTACDGSADQTIPWLAAWISRLEQVLGGVIHRPVRAVRSASTTPALVAERCRYALSIAHSSLPSPLILAFDEEACRAFVDPLLKDTTCLRGSGSLSACEYGALDFLVGEALDALSRDLAGSVAAPADVPAVANPALCGEPSVALARSLLSDGSHAVATLTVGVGSTRGHLLLGIPRGATIGLPQELPRDLAATARATDQVTLRLALPEIELPVTEATTLRRGDVLLLPMTSLTNAMSGLRFTSDLGVDVADVRVTSDEPTVCSAEILRLGIRLRPTAPTDGMVRIRPLVGTARISAATLGHLAVGDSIDAVKSDPDVRLEVSDASRCWTWSGRLVRHGSVLGVRITSLEGMTAETHGRREHHT